MNAPMLARGALARLGIKAYPLSLNYEVTWLCNLACAYCDRHTRLPAELGLEDSLRLLGEFQELGMVETNLDGGEALADRRTETIVPWLVDRGIEVNLNSNGILVPKMLDVVRRVKKLKISVDGPPEAHDAIRGKGSFETAVAGVKAASDAGVLVELSCVVGRHNAGSLEKLLDIAEGLAVQVVFQPALNSLFLESDRDGRAWQLEGELHRTAFHLLEELKRSGRPVGNRWSSLRHFRHFPRERRPPCAAGWVTAALDPEGVLFPCSQLSRKDRSNSALELGAAEAFARLKREGCGQCWCARLVEANYAWGLRVDAMLPTPIG